MDGYWRIPSLCPRRALVSQHIVILLLLTGSHQGESRRVSQTVAALVGDDVILPCHLEPAVDASYRSVEWGRPDLEPRFVHVWYEGRDFLTNQNPSYKGRTSVSAEKLRDGDLSLTLSAVKHSDNGLYRCYFPQLSKETNVRLIVGSIDSAVMTGTKINSSVLDLQCESKGWYPEPKVLWLDGERNVLPAGPTETLRGPGGFYTVSSRLTVQSTHSNTFTCQVHQKNINQSRETHIQISVSQPDSTHTVFHVSITVVVLLGVIVSVAFVIWKWRQKQIKEKKTKLSLSLSESERKREIEREWLITVEQKMEDLEDRKRILEEELKKKEEEEKDLEQMIPRLMEQNKEIQEQTDKLRNQREDMEKSVDEIDDKFQSAEKTAESDKAQGFMEMKTVALAAKKHLQRRKQEDDKLHFKTHLFQNTTDHFLVTITERKRAVESNKREICERLEEIQRKLSEHREKMTQKDDQKKTDVNIL